MYYNIYREEKDMYMRLEDVDHGYYDIYVNGELDCVMDTLEAAIEECGIATREEVCEIYHNDKMVWTDDI